MAWSALGDSAWLFEVSGASSRERLDRVWSLAGQLSATRIAEVKDIVTSFDSLAVHFDPEHGQKVMEWLQTVPPPLGHTEPLRGKVIGIPVTYGGECGPDLMAAADALSLAPEELVRLHREAEYTVAALGFSPGFPYLEGLPPRLQLPRHRTPRAVPAGSVAIAGTQTGIYPSASQGGWHVIGRTSRRLFDPAMIPPALLDASDLVRFVDEKHDLATVDLMEPVPHPNGELEILDPGNQTTVQDHGRHGYQHLGVTPGGAADPVAAAVVNRLVGNPDDAAVLECLMHGPRIRLHRQARVAWLGWSGTHSGRPLELPAGTEIDLHGRTHALRGYLAVAGGIDVPRVLGSRATDVRAGFGGWQGRALQSGDRLPVGSPTRGPMAGGWFVGWPRAQPDKLLELRFVPGMQRNWFPEATLAAFQERIHVASPQSDRMGLRLDGLLLECDRPHEMRSQPVVAGSVQVPPDGRAIVLLGERQTIGGYPQIAHVISADLPALARAWPGTRLRFREVTLEEAREAWRVLRRDLDLLRTGLAMRAYGGSP
jgi:KipI family sensor histidine kinase inhibitor